MSEVLKERVVKLSADVTAYVQCQSFADQELANVSHDMAYNMMTRSYQQIIRVMGLGTKPEHIKVYRQWPADWWQAFKERWFPNWVLRRWPVRYETIDIDRTIYTRFCPHVKIPDNRPHISWLHDLD